MRRRDLEYLFSCSRFSSSSTFLPMAGGGGCAVWESSWVAKIRESHERDMNRRVSTEREREQSEKFPNHFISPSETKKPFVFIHIHLDWYKQRKKCHLFTLLVSCVPAGLPISREDAARNEKHLSFTDCVALAFTLLSAHHKVLQRDDESTWYTRKWSLFRIFFLLSRQGSLSVVQPSRCSLSDWLHLSLHCKTTARRHGKVTRELWSGNWFSLSCSLSISMYNIVSNVWAFIWFIWNFLTCFFRLYKQYTFWRNVNMSETRQCDKISFFFSLFVEARPRRKWEWAHDMKLQCQVSLLRSDVKPSELRWQRISSICEGREID